MESDSDIAGTDTSSDIAADIPAAHGHRPYRPVSIAKIFLLVASSTYGFWRGSPYLSTLQQSPLELAERAMVIGLIVASWTMHPHNAALTEEELAMRAAANVKSASSIVHGHVQWQVSQVASFIEQFPLEEGTLPGSVVAHHSNDFQDEVT